MSDIFIIKKRNLLCFLMAIFLVVQSIHAFSIITIIAAVLILFIQSPNHIKYISLNKQFLLMFCFIILSSIYTGMNSVTISYIVYFVSMYIILDIFIRYNSVSDLVNIIYFVTIISISYFVFELVYLHGFDLSKATELSSVFSGRNIFGMFICLGLSASLYRNFRSNSSTHNYGFSLILFYSTILILLGSRSSMISMVIGILAFYYYNKSIGKPLLIGAVITLLLMSVSVLSYDYLSQNIRFLNSNSTADDSNLIRVVLIMAAVDLFLNNPLLGVGANMFIPKSAIFLEYLNTDGIISVDLSAGLATHNSYIQYLVELGLIVTIIVILKIIKLIFTLIKLRKRSLSKTQRLELAFIFAFSLNIITSAAFMNLHSSIIFMFVILVAEKMAKQVYFANNLN